MRILWLSWKDEGHPEAGGAEKVSGELRRQLIKNGHSVTLVTARYTGSLEDEDQDGVSIHRTGGRFTVYRNTRRYCRAHLHDWPDVVIDEMNTVPFAASLYYRDKPVYLLAYQLAREVWFYQMKFPLSLIGYLSEPIMLFALSKTGYKKVLTESESSRQDMARYGFRDIDIFHIWLDLSPIQQLAPKNQKNLILSLGAVRPMKRTLHAVKAFEHAYATNDSLRMTIAGDIRSPYAQRVKTYVNKSPAKSAITFTGRVSNAERLELMRKAAIILVTSIKEGWGLIVTEANSQGTPAIVYNTDGLRDSVINDESGLVTPKGNTKAMGETIIMLLNDDTHYNRLRENAWEYSKTFTPENMYTEFQQTIPELSHD